MGHALELGGGADGQLLQGLVLETMGVLCQDSFMGELMGSFSRVQSMWQGLGLAETVWWGPGRGASSKYPALRGSLQMCQ